jgi:chromosomal replication initiation ATPase DnaA
MTIHPAPPYAAYGRPDRSERDSACRFIESLVAAALRVDRGELTAASRGRAPAALARQTGMYLAHVTLGLSLSQVAAGFRRDRATVAHACLRIEESRDDPSFELVLAILEAALRNWRRGFLPAGAAR